MIEFYIIIQAYIVRHPCPVVTAGLGDTNYVNAFCSWLKYTIEFSICYLLGNIFYLSLFIASSTELTNTIVFDLLLSIINGFKLFLSLSAKAPKIAKRNP